MNIFNPYWGGLDCIQDTPAEDGCALMFLPSLASDALAGRLQLDAESSVQQDMQNNFRLGAENMFDSGLLISASI